MPEEKKQNKAAAKDSFTFSDKIKNSKPAGSKSFANRISSKIGSDGKPRKTLFERTKRDAPFFIAAIVALLLLPFLYKYSGSVGEEPAMVTPGAEDTLFDPNRSGFDGIGDPEGQIAQLAGRDSMDLIVGFGNKKEVEESDDLPARADWGDRSGLDDSYGSSKNNSEEYNTTNVYRQRKQAAPATRAAFKKTPINTIRNAGLTSRSGGKLSVGMWGGSMKKAADKVKGDAPKSSPKPVSLQPLQAAGKPSRSYFGQGAAAEARRSKDAMSKANAMQALMDAQMKPIEPGKIGGIGGGDFGGPGGGNGNLERKFAFNGKEPWWWDMMKQRSQMEWEKKFNYRWGWIDFATGLAQKLADGLVSCLITGTDDWSMGKMFGAGAGAGSGAECCGLNEEKWGYRFPGIPFNETACKANKKKIASEDKNEGCGWVEAKKNSVSLGPIAQRLDCLSNGLGAAWNRMRSKDTGSFTEANACQSFAMDRIYRAKFTSSKNKDWSVYHYVVGVATGKDGQGLDTYYTKSDPQKQRELLVIGYFAKGNTFRDYEKVQNRKDFVPLFVESVAIKSKKVDAKKSAKASQLDDKVSFKGYWGTGGTSKGTCGHFENVSFAEAKAKCQKMSWLCKNSCLEQISSQIKGKDKAEVLLSIMTDGANTNVVSYQSFIAMLRDGGIMYDSVDADSKSPLGLASKGGKQGKDWITGARCAYPLVRVSCENFANTAGSFMNTAGQTIDGQYPFAHLKFTNGMSSDNVYEKMKRRFIVGYSMQGEDNANPEAITTSTSTAQGQFFIVPHMTLQPFNGTWRNEDRGVVIANGTAKSKPGSYSVVATSPNITANMKAGKRVILTWAIYQCPVDTLLIDGSSINDGGCHNGNIGVYDDNGNRVASKGQDKFGIPVSTATCVYYQGGDVKGSDDSNGEDEDDEDDEDDNDPDDCNGDPNKSLACCQNLRPGYTYNANHNPKCYKEDDDDGVVPSVLPLAETIPGIVTEYQSRNPVKFPQGPGKVTSQVFGSCRFTGIENKAVYNNKAAVSYVTSVLSKVNEDRSFRDAHKTIVHTGSITVANLVDALTLAYQQNQNAQVPQEVVCSLGKTIGYYSRDPELTRKNNMFGAFAAYIDENSSFFPANLNSQGNPDDRFGPCSKRKKYHYGYYNWNHLRLGSEGAKYGKQGRTPYLNFLAGNNTKGFYWGKTGDFPLADIGKSIAFSITESKEEKELKPYNGTIDDFNRQMYHDAYQNLYRNLNDHTKGCGLSGAGDMDVSKALEYIGRVCSNGPSAKPTNGDVHSTCGTEYAASNETGGD